jgi:hypothetical protein
VHPRIYRRNSGEYTNSLMFALKMRYASSASMNKTVYLRDDEEVSVWERARELSGDKLSPVILAALKVFITAKEAENSGYKRILVEFNDARDHMLPKKNAFYGKWIISPNAPHYEDYELEHRDQRDFYLVAETAKGSVVVIKHSEGDDEDGHWVSGKKFLVFASFHDAAANDEVNSAVLKAVELRGVPVQELDI